jgi:hypothetical protein
MGEREAVMVGAVAVALSVVAVLAWVLAWVLLRRSRPRGHGNPAVGGVAGVRFAAGAAPVYPVDPCTGLPAAEAGGPVGERRAGLHAAARAAGRPTPPGDDWAAGWARLRAAVEQERGRDGQG